MSKKIISVLLVFSMILSLLACTVSAESDTALIISAPSSAVPGDSINVTVSIPQNTNAVSGSFVFIYDNKNLEISTATAGTILKDYNVNINKSYSENSVKLTFDGDRELTDGGILLTLAFNVVQGASGTAEFKTEKFKLYDADYNAISANSSSSAATYIINDAKMQLSIDGVKTAVTGDEITVNVNLSNPTGVCGGSFNLVYDSDKLILRSAAAGMALNGFTKQLNKSYAENKIRLTWAGSNQISESGVILTAVFKVRIGVKGTAEFTAEKLKLADVNASPLACLATGLETEITCNHSVMDWIVTTEPTCLADGEEAYMCGCGYSTDTRAAKATGHRNMQWNITKEATCDEDGEKAYTCADCGYTEKTEAVAAHGHGYEDIVTQPTKADKGYTTHRCKYCGDSYTDSETEALGYQITYDANGGENAPAAQTKKHGEDILLSDIVPTKTGCTFLGWATDKEAENAEYYAGNTYAADEDAAFYALWQTNEYTVTYIVDGETTSVQTYNYGDIINAAAEPAKQGYTFSGWSDIPITMPAENIEITGSFTVNSYTVTFDANGGENAPAEITDTYLKEVTIPTEIPEKAGCSFLGWAKKAAAKKADYKVGDTVSLDENITLYAVWQGIWNGTAADGFDGGKGTKTNPYRIATAEQLAYLAERVNAGDETYNSAYYILTNNIVLNDTSNVANWTTEAPANEWTPIGRSNSPFYGTFDGNGYTVSGLYINKTGDTEEDNFQGLFGVALEQCVLSNLGLVSGYIHANDEIGALAGGIAGTIKNCYNECVISGRNDLGGLTGSLRGEIISSYNKGNISGNRFIGGLVGGSRDVDENTPTKYISCYNIGKVLGDSSHIGGISGYAIADSCFSEVDSCYNIGEVSGTAYVGGICGYTQSNTTQNINVSGCYNKGTIKGSEKRIGGIVGHAQKTTIQYCYNIGSISTINYDVGGDCGGICGIAAVESKISNCFNLGFITTKCGLGGIASVLQTNSSIANCLNFGKISGYDIVGGICGGYDIGSNPIICSINIGSVVGTNNIGAVVGTSYATGVDSCYYLDTCGASGKGTALTYVQMQSAANYAHYSVTYKNKSWSDAWQMGSNPFTVYPMLKGMDNLMENPIEFDLNGGNFDEYELCASVVPSTKNTDRGFDYLVLYTDEKASTGTNIHGYEVIVNSRGIVTDIQGSKGNAAIPKGGFVLSGHGIMYEWLKKNISLGDKVTYNPGNCNEINVYKKNPKFTYAINKSTYLPTPHREGYVFSGWCDEDGKIITYDYTFSSPNGVKLTAKWAKPNEITRKTYNGNTYIMFDEATTWESAKKYCEEIGGHLATVTDANEWAFIADFVKNNGNNDLYYLGASDSENEGEWKWVTGEPFSYTAWSTGNPDNNSYIQDYLLIWYSKSNPLWDDVQPIYNMAGFICEIENLTPTSSMIYNGHLYQLYDKDIDWHAAKEYCENIGGHLVTISNQLENEAVMKFTKSYGTTSKWYWLGGTDEEQEDVWKWVTDEEWSYTNWTPTQPDNSGGKEHYLHMYYNSDTLKGQWNDVPIKCADNGFICEFDFIEPAATTSYNGHEYRLYDISCTWENAKEYCDSIGGYFATVTSADEQQQIETLLENGNKNQYWLGGTDVASEGTWRWLTGEEWNYTKWDSGQPDNSASKEHYLQIYKNAHPNTSNSQYKWNDSPNDNVVEPYSFFGKNTVGFICEFGNTDTYTPVGSFIHNGHYYEIYDNNLHWNYAKDYCEQNGGHLVTITDEEEQNAIISALDKYSTIQHYWLGLTDLNETGTYKWITGEDTDYMNFPEGRPNKDDKHWVDLSIMPNQKGYWYDYYSTYEDMGFICEYETLDKCSYTVTYDANGGEELSKEQALVEKNKNADLSVTAARNGYTFLGWNTDKNAAEPLTEYIVTENVTLYAVWEKKDITVNTYTVSYDANGGEGLSKAEALAESGSNADLSVTAARNGYNFLGWNTDKNAAEPLSEYIVTGNVTLYAIWKENDTELPEDMFWSFENGKLTITGNDAMSDFSDSSAAPWHKHKDEITSIEIADGVTSIAESSFSKLRNATSVSIADSVTSIGKNAFWYCSSLENITIGENVAAIGEKAFANCANLKNVVLNTRNDSLPDALFENCGVIESVILPHGIRKFSNAFAGTIISKLTYSGTKEEFKQAMGDLKFTAVECMADGKTYSYDDFVDKTIDVQEITLNKKDLGLKIGESSRLVATVKPDDASNKNVVWTSGNPLAATVDDEGNVTAVGIGVAAITATTEDGGMSASCIVYVDKAQNVTEPTIYVSNVSAKNSDTIEVLVSVQNNPGIISAKLNVSYNDTVMKLKKVEDLGIWGSAIHSASYNKAPYTLYWDNGTAAANFINNGKLARLTFDIADNAASGEYPIEVTYSSSDIIDSDLMPVSFEVENGNVSIDSFIYGDVNGDKSVNTIDSAILSRYLAKWSGINVDLSAADVNKDKKINVLDSAILKRHIADWSGYEYLPYSPTNSADSIGLMSAVQPTISVSSQRGYAGNTVDVYVAVNDNPGIISARLNINYDSSKLELVNVEDLGLIPGKMHSEDYSTYPYVLFWDNGAAADNYTGNGKFARLTFKIKDGAENGNAEISVSYDENNFDILNYKLNAVHFETENGNIEILENKPKMIASDVSSGSRLSCRVNMYHPDSVSGALVVAVYKQNRLVNLTTYNASPEVLVDISSQEGDTAKIMWWSSLSQPIPVVSCEELELK